MFRTDQSSNRSRPWWALALSTGLAFRALGGTIPAPDFSKFAPSLPFSSLLAAAGDRQIPIEGIDPPGEPGSLNPDDSFAALVMLHEKGGKETQWLIHLVALPASPRARSRSRAGPMVLYSGRGTKFEYGSSPALVQLRTLGPFVEPGKKQPKFEEPSVRFALDKGFLSLGLEHAAAAICRAEETSARGNLWFGSAPPTAAQTAEARQFAENLQLTDDEERAIGGMIPALLSYFEVVRHTQGLEEILLKVVDKPSVWSVVRHVGVEANLGIDSKHFAPADPTAWGLEAGRPTFYFPMFLELNHRLALTVTFVVTTPSPPLLSCGGIVGMLAERPGEPQTYLTLRIISARCSGTNDKPPSL